MDQAEFDAIMKRGRNLQPATPEATPAAPEQPPNTEAPQVDLDGLTSAAQAAGVELPDVADLPGSAEQVVDGVGQLQENMAGSGMRGTINPMIPFSFATGAIKSAFETKDFLFGDTPADDRSDVRKVVEGVDQANKDASIFGGVASGIGQFSGAMFGLGKFTAVAKSLPWFGQGLKAVVGAVEASKKGRVALEVGKAATAGSIAFDPHEERLSNLFAGTFLQNPVTDYLAADPDDSASEGRLKAALESIAMDATLIGVFLSGTKVWKYLRKGDAEGASRVVAEHEKAVQNADADVGGAGLGSDVPPSVDDGLGAGGQAVAVEPAAAPEAQVGQAAPGVTDDTLPVGASAGEPNPTGSPDAGPGAGTQAGRPQAAQVEGGDFNAIDPTGSKSSPEGFVKVGDEAGPAVGPDGAPLAAGDDAIAAGEDAINARMGRLRVTDEDTEALLKGLEADAKALSDNGMSFAKAIEAGHTFGRGEGIPYGKLFGDAGSNDVEVQSFLDRVVEQKQDAMDRVRGGGVVTDEQLNGVVENMTKLFNEDPSQVIGAIQRAGKNAREAVAYMETGYLVTSRIFQDAYALAQRINLGDYSGFGNREGAIADLRKRLSVGASVYAAGRSITAAAGRGVRRMRWEFAVDPLQMQALTEMDGEELAKLVTATEGDPRKMAKVANPTWFQRGMSGLGWLLVNNLVSGPKTQLINLMSNGYMLGVRPLERIIGGGLSGNQQAFKEGLRQHVYMGSVFTDSFQLAAKAFLRNDSVLNPHQIERFQPSQSMGAAASSLLPPPKWKPWTNVQGILSNALTVATPSGALHTAAAAIGLPTRALGSVDELMSQITYRSKIMAHAHTEAIEQAAKLPAGTTEAAKKAFVKQFIRDRVDNSVDANGKALDADALREAQITTFQQDLLPGTFGRTMQSMVFKHPGLRLVLPFVKTPTNVLRYGWKMTPGLNLLQGEYRQMLSGSLGKEAQSQAVGQMVLGTLFAGSAAYMVSQGTLTGGGPQDYATRSSMMGTGWQEYSIVVQNEDGSKTYIPYNRYDPVAMPIGIMADIMDAMVVHDGPTPEIETAIGALGYALARQMTNKSYLMGVSDLLEVLNDPDPDKISRWAGRQASNFIPFSAANRQLNGDPYMREVRTMVDQIKSGLPGYSKDVPIRYDWLGEPRLMRKGLWSSTDDEIVDNEVIRLGLENDGRIPPVATPYHNGVDLRDVTLETGENAFEAYQRLSGQPTLKSPTLKSVIAKAMQGEAYKKAPDGEVGVKGTKLWLLHRYYSKYRDAAMKVLKHDPKVREAFGEDLKKVRDHYSGLRGEAPRYPKKDIKSLDAVGETYGIDLLEGEAQQ